MNRVENLPDWTFYVILGHGALTTLWAAVCALRGRAAALRGAATIVVIERLSFALLVGTPLAALYSLGFTDSAPYIAAGMNAVFALAAAGLYGWVARRLREPKAEAEAV